MRFLRKYNDIIGKDGTVYMRRWWIFNRYDRKWHIPFLPSIRLHHICVPDQDRHLHDHPWNARTIIIKGYYIEVREDGVFVRDRWCTGKLKFGQYHRIASVSNGGVWTIFITFKYRGTWGFKVDGKKVPWKTYLGVKK